MMPPVGIKLSRFVIKEDSEFEKQNSDMKKMKEERNKMKRKHE